jgi:CheY-like chemotaxis protein
MDLNLPGMGGFEALERLRRSEHTRKIPVIALTANAMAHQIEKGLKAGFFAYLTKPVNVAEVRNAIRDAFGAARSSSAGENV